VALLVALTATATPSALDRFQCGWWMVITTA